MRLILWILTLPIVLVAIIFSVANRGLVEFKGKWLTIGGMAADQRVTDAVFAYEFE